MPNPASVRLHEAAGFEPIGTYENVGYKHGAWRDVRWWHRQLRSLPDDPTDPLGLDDVVGSEECDQAFAAGDSWIDL